MRKLEREREREINFVGVCVNSQYFVIVGFVCVIKCLVPVHRTKRSEEVSLSLSHTHIHTHRMTEFKLLSLILSLSFPPSLSLRRSRLVSVSLLYLSILLSFSLFSFRYQLDGLPLSFADLFPGTPHSLRSGFWMYVKRGEREREREIGNECAIKERYERDRERGRKGGGERERESLLTVCTKDYKKLTKMKNLRNPYDLGTLANWTQFLGPSVLTWLLPVFKHESEGVSWPIREGVGKYCLEDMRKELLEKRSLSLSLFHLSLPLSSISLSLFLSLLTPIPRTPHTHSLSPSPPIFPLFYSLLRCSPRCIISHQQRGCLHSRSLHFSSLSAL